MKNFARSLPALAFAVLLFCPRAQAAERGSSTLLAVDHTNSIIEGISVDSSSILGSAVILKRLGIKPGQVLTSDAMRQIEANLRTLPIPHVLRYLSGTKPGEVVVTIKDTVSAYDSFGRHKPNTVEEGC